MEGIAEPIPHLHDEYDEYEDYEDDRDEEPYMESYKLYTFLDPDNKPVKGSSKTRKLRTIIRSLIEDPMNNKPKMLSNLKVIENIKPGSTVEEYDDNSFAIKIPSFSSETIRLGFSYAHHSEYKFYSISVEYEYNGAYDYRHRNDDMYYRRDSDYDEINHSEVLEQVLKQVIDNLIAIW